MSVWNWLVNSQVSTFSGTEALGCEKEEDIGTWQTPLDREVDKSVG